MVGTGTRLQVSTCNEHTDFDTIISIYTGTCDDLTCVANDDDSCGFVDGASIAEFDSTLGTIYYLVVHGYLGAVGDYGISVTEVAAKS